MTSLRNKRELAAVAKKYHEEHPRNIWSRNTAALQINADFITQVSEEIEARMTKELSQEFSGTDRQILGALSQLDEFFPNPHVRAQSGTVPETSRSSDTKNQEPNEESSQNDPRPEASSSMYSSPRPQVQTQRKPPTSTMQRSHILLLTKLSIKETI